MLASCTPRALHSWTPGGSRSRCGAMWSTPALSVCTTRTLRIRGERAGAGDRALHVRHDVERRVRGVGREVLARRPSTRSEGVGQPVDLLGRQRHPHLGSRAPAGRAGAGGGVASGGVGHGQEATACPADRSGSVRVRPDRGASARVARGGNRAADGPSAGRPGPGAGQLTARARTRNRAGPGKIHRAGGVAQWGRAGGAGGPRAREGRTGGAQEDRARRSTWARWASDACR